MASSLCSYVTVQGPCIDRVGSVHCAGTDRAGSVHQVFIVQGPCRDRAGTVHGVFFCCCMDRAGTVHRLSGAERPTCRWHVSGLSESIIMSPREG